MRRFLAATVLAVAAVSALARPTLDQVGEFPVPEANQGVGVDGKYFYAVDNQVVAKYDKRTGKLVKKWTGEKKGPVLHLDSAM
jgi:hypothetical protein